MRIRPAAPEPDPCPQARTIAGSELVEASELTWQQWAAAHPLDDAESDDPAGTEPTEPESLYPNCM